MKGDQFGRVCIAIPHLQFAYWEFWVDILHLNSQGMREGDAIWDVANLPTHRARNELVRAFLRMCNLMREDGREPFDALCFIDSDMRFDKDTLERLRSNPGNDEYDVVQAWYCMKYWPPNPIMMERTQTDAEWGIEGWWFKFMHDWKWGELVECDGVGGGFTLIRREVFEALVDKERGIEKTCFFAYTNDSTEDLYFCKHAREAGFRIAVDTRVICRHIRHAYTGPEQYMRWRNGIRDGIYDEKGNKVGDTANPWEDLEEGLKKKA